MRNLFRELEERLLGPDTRRSAKLTAELLDEDFIEIGRSGATYDRQQVLDLLATEPLMERHLTDLSVRALSDTVTLVTYRSTRRDPISGQEWHSLRSSVWRLSDGRWRMTFHQGTATRPRP